jgi:hypothetical protein
MTSLAMNLLERDLVPDFLIRRRIRALLAGRLREEEQRDPELQQQRLLAFIRKLAASAVAIETAAANAQHHEVPTDFCTRVLGKHLKHSSDYFPSPGPPSRAEAAGNLDAAEARMLALTCRRARLADGERILELGCGWGSLSLWMAANYPGAAITAVSNSRTQKLHIDARARKRGLRNLEVITCDPFEVRDESDWLARFFFTGGILPERRPAALFPARRPDPRSLAGTGLALFPDQRSLVTELGPASGRAHAVAGAHLRRRPGVALVGALARVFHGLRGVVGIRGRPRMAGIALPL